MARYRLQGSALTTIGGAVRVVPGATITFTAKGASSPATLYESNTGTSNYGTSVTADENGQYDVYVEYAEYYDAEFTVGSRTVDERFYLDPSEAVLEAKDETFDARDKAKQWANEDEDVAVENGEYSAKHWSKKARAIVVSSVESVIDDTISDAKKAFDGRALTKAELIASPDVVVGQSVDVLEVGRVILVAASTYTANGATVIDLTGSGLQAVLAPGEALANPTAVLSDTRPASWFTLDADASVFQTLDGHAYKPVSSGTWPTTSGGVKVQPLLDATGRFVDVAFGADGTDFTALQLALDKAAGSTLVLTKLHALGASTLSMSNNGTKLLGENGGGFSYTDETASGLTVSGDDCEVAHLTINAPATFDGAAGEPTYGVMWITGDRAEIHHNTLNNVPKNGIAFDEADAGHIHDNFIFGNYPQGSFTGTEVGHRGIRINPTSTGLQGFFQVRDNFIEGCVQGVLNGNFGASSLDQNLVITGNTFHQCWNHGVYSSSYSRGVSVAANTFSNCQKPIALEGENHAIVGNTMHLGGSSGTLSDWTGISMRDATGCVIGDNTIKGEGGTNQSVISFVQTSKTDITKNTVADNTVEIVGSGTAQVVRFGDGDTVDLSDNHVTGNTLIGASANLSGIIQMQGASSGCFAEGMVIANNTVVIKGDCYGINLVYLQGAQVTGNTIRLEADNGSSSVTAAIKMIACEDMDVTNNRITCTANWGTNFSLRGIWEQTSGSGGRAANNTFRADLTKLSSATHYVTDNASGIIISDVGEGAPTMNAGVGSTWGRTDGGTGTSFYVKESGTTSAGWVGK